MSNDRPLKQKVSVTLDMDLLLELAQRAEEDDRPLSQYINRALKIYLAQEKHREKDPKF